MEKDKEEFQEESINIELTEKQKKFCHEYILDWNGARAYQVTYPDCKNYDSVRAAASRLLTNVNVKNYISELQSELEKVAGVSRLMVVNEFKKLAFSNIAKLHNTWIERKDFDALTDEEKACIESIETKTQKYKTDDEGVKIVEYIKIKIYDKQRALENISKMLGYNEPDKMDIKTNVVWHEVKTYDPNDKTD